MARTKFTVTFPAAKAGDQVTWPNTVKVYPDKDSQVPLQPGQSLDETLTLSGWSESASVAFSRRKTDGTTETVTITSASPTGTGPAVPTSAAYMPLAAGFTGAPRPPVITLASQLAGIDTANGQMLFISSGGPSLFTSADFGVSFSVNRTLPAGVNWYDCKKIVAFGTKLYLLTITGSRTTVYSTTPNYTAGQTWTWTSVLTAAGTDNLPTCLSTDGTWLYVGEYGDPAGGPQIWRSNDGTTWTSVLGPLTGNRHCHAVEPDPYNPGHVWATFGDGGNTYVMRSTNYGATWSMIVDGTPPHGSWAQVVQISFDASRVWFASDDLAGSIYTIDRTELKPRFAATNRHSDLAVPAAVPRNGGSWFTDGVFTNGSTTLTSATAAFVASDVGRSIFSSKVPGGDIQIATVTNATTVTLTQAASSGGTATFTLGGSRWPAVAYFGAVDPTTGIYYLAALDHAVMDDPYRAAIMYLPAWGARVEMFNTLPPVNGLTRWQVFLYGGYVWHSRYRIALLSRT